MISIHALREEGDATSTRVRSSSSRFLSTPSARRATWQGGCNYNLQLISIHALREEGDRAIQRIQRAENNFYPRPPRGGRPVASRLFESQQKFLSTPSARRATLSWFPPAFLLSISIHALREEGDESTLELSHPTAISIHALREEGDISTSFQQSFQLNFYPRPPRGGRQGIGEKYLKEHIFLSTPSARRATCDKILIDSELVISIHALREEGDSKNRDKISIFKQIIQHSARI